MSELIKVSDLANPFGIERKFWAAIREQNPDFERDDESTWSGGWSLDFWESFLHLAEISGLVSNPPSPFGIALNKRYRWLQNARARGISSEQAEKEFSDNVDRSHEIDHRIQTDGEIQRAREVDARAAQYRSGRRRGVEAEI